MYEGHAGTVPWVLPPGRVGSPQQTMEWQWGFQLCREKETRVSHKQQLRTTFQVKSTKTHPIPPIFMSGNHHPWQQTQLTIQPHGQMTWAVASKQIRGSRSHMTRGKKPPNGGPGLYSLLLGGSCTVGLSEDALVGQDPLVSKDLVQEPVIPTPGQGSPTGSRTIHI